MKRLRSYFPILLLLIAEVLFLSYKIGGLSFRFGDTTAYWYMATKVAEGLLPYRDFFLADPPVYILFLVPFVALLRDHLIVLQLLPALLEMLSAAGLFFFLKREKVTFFWLAPVLYLFSFTILATSDYGTGLQLATALYITSLLFWQHKKYWLMGGFLALACLTKLYMAPAVLGVLLFFIYKKQYQVLLKVTAGGLIVTSLVVLPFFLVNPSVFIDDVITHHFFRPSGTSKLEVFSFLLQRDGVFILFALIGMYIKKKHLLVLPFFLQLFFFLFFKDVYYAYLGSLLPYVVFFACLSLCYFRQKGENYKRMTEMALIVMSFGLLYTNFSYWSEIYSSGKFTTVSDWQQKIEKLPENYPLYGSHEVAPLVALLTNKEIFNNTIDTNTQTFASGAHDREKLSKAAADRGVYLFIWIITNPVNKEAVYVYERFFSPSIFEKHCQLVAEDPPDPMNEERIALFKCKS